MHKVLRFLAICTIGFACGTWSLAQTITTFDAPGAGTGAGQGTLPMQNTQGA